MDGAQYISPHGSPVRIGPYLIKVSLILSVILGLAVALINLKLLALLVLGTIVAALFFIRFDLGVLVFVVLVPLSIQLPGGLHHLISYSLSGILVFSWLIRKFVSTEEFAPLNHGLVLFMILYILWGLSCSLHSEHPSTGVLVTLRQLLFFGIFYVLYDWMRSPKEIGLIINAMIAMGIIASLPAIVEVLSTGFSNIFRFGSPMLFGGIYTGVNALGMHLSFILVIAASKFLYVDLPRKRWLSLIFVLIIGFALFFTFSRSAWLLAVVAVSMILFRFKKGRMFVLTTLILLGLLILLSPQVEKLSGVIVRLESGITNRDILWKGAIGMIKENPIFGVGPGSFKHFIVDYAPRYPWRWPVVTFGGITGGDSHNFFLSRAAETGIVGLALIFYFFINYFQVYSRGIRKAKLLRLEHVLFGAGAVVIGALARGFFEGKGIMGGGGVSFELFFWLMVAFTLRVSESFKNQAIK